MHVDQLNLSVKSVCQAVPLLYPNTEVQSWWWGRNTMISHNIKPSDRWHDPDPTPSIYVSLPRQVTAVWVLHRINQVGLMLWLSSVSHMHLCKDGPHFDFPSLCPTLKVEGGGGCMCAWDHAAGLCQRYTIVCNSKQMKSSREFQLSYWAFVRV